MDHSELLESKVIDAHDRLWERVTRFERQLPHPIGSVLFRLMICTPEELEELRKDSKLQFRTDDKAFGDISDLSDLLLLRPYIDDRLWEMAHSRLAFVMRLLILFSKGKPNPVPMTNWPEDELVKTHLLNAFSEQELEQINYSRPGAYQQLVVEWDLRILAGIKNRLFGRD